MLLEGGKVVEESPMSMSILHHVKPMFRRSSGNAGSVPMIIHYVLLTIDPNTATCMVKFSIRYSMIGSADVTIYSNLLAQPIMFRLEWRHRPIYPLEV